MTGKRILHPLTASLTYTLVLALASLLVYSIDLPPSSIFLLSAPLILSGLYYPRKVYLFLILLTTAVAIWLSLVTSPLPDLALVTLAIAAPTVWLITEGVAYYARSVQHAEQDLADHEARLRRHFESAASASLITDETGVVTEWNHPLEIFTGLKRSEAVGRPVWDLLLKLLPEDQKSRAVFERLKSTFGDLLRKGQSSTQPLQFDQPILNGSGSLRTLRIQVTPIRVDGGYILAAQAEDVTEAHSEDTHLRNTNELLTLTIKEMEERSQETAVLNEMSELLQSCRSVAEAYAVMSQYAIKIFHNGSGILYVLDSDLKLFEAVSSWGSPVGSEPSFTPDACWTLRRGRVHAVVDPANRLVCPHINPSRGRAGFIPYMCVPMTAQGETLGVLHIQVQPGQSIEQLELLATPVASRVGLAVANLKLRESLRVQSIRDPLTGLFNRRYMEETLERELHRSARHQLPLGVIMLDIDHFKAFNDTYSHEAGDDLLREMGVFLQANVRSEDVPCRYGGEEFIIILPEASLEDTMRRAEQVHEGISGLKIQRGGQALPAITVSQGVAGFPEHGASAGQLLRAVDAALYRAKRGGRDRVSLAER